MHDLKRHEILEIQTLGALHKSKVLNTLVFGGGSMLRLCFDLPRYSIDLDFCLQTDPSRFKREAPRLDTALAALGAVLSDRQEKHHSWLWEFRVQGFPRKLKIEIRKESISAARTELGIAHSAHASAQVRLRVLSLKQMWLNKVRALQEHREIRDAYDLEFLTLRRAAAWEDITRDDLQRLIKVLDALKPADYKVTLGSVLDTDERQRVISSRFSYLKSQLAGRLI
jgi:predicted nucleotidyltransferase component of viral defense system